MSKLPWCPFYPADHVRDTRCLSLAARGAWIDVLCCLWHAPVRGKKTLSLQGWANELGQPVAEVAACLAELERCGVAKVVRRKSPENLEEITISSKRMLRDEDQRKRKAKQKKDQRDRSMSTPLSPPCPASVSSMSPVESDSESESDSEKREERESRKREKRVGEAQSLARPAKGPGCWQAYKGSYERIWGCEPIRNARVNSDLSRLVDRLGPELAERVAAFYPTHQRKLYREARHPTNLLLRDCESLATDLQTGQGAAEPRVPKTMVELIAMRGGTV